MCGQIMKIMQTRESVIKVLNTQKSVSRAAVIVISHTLQCCSAAVY